MTQRQLAEAAHASPITLSRIETGRIRAVMSDLLSRLAGALGTSTDELLGRMPEKYNAVGVQATKVRLALEGEKSRVERLLLFYGKLSTKEQRLVLLFVKLLVAEGGRHGKKTR